MLVPAVLDKPTPVHAKVEPKWRAKRKSVDVFIFLGIGFVQDGCEHTEAPPMDFEIESSPLF